MNKKVVSLFRAKLIGMTAKNWQKVVRFFSEKIGVTPSVAAPVGPDDTHSSDATDSTAA